MSKCDGAAAAGIRPPMSQLRCPAMSGQITHEQRMRCAMLSLDGLSVGDAFGECFFAIGTDPYAWQQHLDNREPPIGRWRYTDDTEMALTILEVLGRHQRIDQDDLAETFARRYARDDRRGYGGMAHR